MQATGQVLVDLAAQYEGNWLGGAASSFRSLREWDAAEDARYIERLQAAAAQATPALVSLSLLSPQLQAPCERAADALVDATRARGRENARRCWRLISPVRSSGAAPRPRCTRSPRPGLRGAGSCAGAVCVPQAITASRLP